MPDDAATGQDPAPNPTETVNPVLPPDPPHTPEPPDPRITRANNEAAAARVKVKELEQKLRDAETGQEPLKQQIADAQAAREKAELDARMARAEAVAVKAGVVDPDAAQKLLNWESVAAGKTIEEAMAELVAAKPWLTAKPVPTAPAGSPTNPASNGPKLTLEALRSMTRKQIMELPDAELNAALRAG